MTLIRKAGRESTNHELRVHFADALKYHAENGLRLDEMALDDLKVACRYT